MDGWMVVTTRKTQLKLLWSTTLQSINPLPSEKLYSSTPLPIPILSHNLSFPPSIKPDLGFITFPLPSK